jgi:hypothetical protein
LNRDNVIEENKKLESNISNELNQEILEKIKSKGIDKDQYMEYLVRTIDSYYMKYKIFRNQILHLPGNDVYCLKKR